MKKRIELDAPNVSELEKQYLCKCIGSGFVSTFGPFVIDFEDKFSEYLRVKKSVSTQSGTAAIHIALHELGIGRGDEVIVPVSTFVATVNPLIYLGAKPVFVDIDNNTWNINAEEIEKNITKKTKAIIPVHLYGNPCDMDKIMRIAQKYGLYVIEDATESLGATYKGKYTGTFGDFGCFSFNGNKTITTGGGGMVVGNNLKRLEHIKFLINQARDESGGKGYYHPEVGFNYRMTNLEASLGLAQMNRLREFLAKKERFSQIYEEELKKIKNVHIQKKYKGAKSSYWITAAVFDNTDIGFLQKELKLKGIPTRRIFMPLVEFPPYIKYKKGKYENSYKVYEKGLCLPSSTLNSDDDIHHVCETIKELLGK